MIQQAWIVGRLGRDPEAKATDRGDTFAVAPVAVTKKVKGDEITTWWNLTCWGKQAEAFVQWARKGMLIAAAGDFELREFRAKDGAIRQTPALRANTLTWTQTQSKDSPEKPVKTSACYTPTGDVPF